MSRAKKIIIALFLIAIITVICILTVIYVRLDKDIDISLIKKCGTTVSKIYYFDYQDRLNRVGEPKELKEEEIFFEKSEWKSLYSMPQNLKNAFVAIEDKRFFKHNGVDWLRTGKAILNYVFKFDKSGYGGSTITQQLIKNFTGDNDVSPKRKIEEIYRAINIENNFSKNEILEAYLNVVYMSQNCYGVGAAADLYFNKRVEDLTLTECAALVSIVQNPKKYDPYTNPENNAKRRQVVLKEMLNQGYISEQQYNSSLNDTLKVSQDVDKYKNSGTYSWYTEALLSEASKDIAEKYGLNQSAARNLILKGGYNIYSVIDRDLQEYVEKVYEQYPAYINNQNGTYPESGCVVIDPYTSDILAIAGGTGKKSGNLLFNRAIDAKRPLGSVIKPLSVYAPGLEEKVFNFATVYDDTPLKLENGEYWPKNSPDRYRGLMPIAYAVEHSVNTVAVKALRDVGIKHSLKYLKRFGINTSNVIDENESSLALGQLSNGESLLNVTNAYTAFVNGGYVSTPKTYLYITDNFGNKIIDKETKSEIVISPQNAYIMTMMLKGVVDTGTASYIKLSEKIAVAGKTGTTSNNEDKWFIGYTPYLTCGVWTGYDTPRPMYYEKNPSCVIFDKIMEYAHREVEDYIGFPAPLGVYTSEFCFDSGMVPTKSCENDMRGSRVISGYFQYDDLPTEKCPFHKLVYIDSDGLISEGFVPFWKRHLVSLLDYDREKQDGITPLDDAYLISKRRKN